MSRIYIVNVIFDLTSNHLFIFFWKREKVKKKWEEKFNGENSREAMNGMEIREEKEGGEKDSVLQEGRGGWKKGKVGNKNESRIMQVSDIRCRGRIVDSIPRGAGPLANRHPRFPGSNVNYLSLCSRNGDLSLSFYKQDPLYPALLLSLPPLRSLNAKMFRGSEMEEEKG